MPAKRFPASLLALFSVAALTLTGCAAVSGGGPAAKEGDRTVESVLGPVTVPETIESVVVLEGRRDLDIVLSLGLPLTGYPYEEAAALDLEAPVAPALARAVGASPMFLAEEVNLEAIAEAAPTLIVSRIDDVEPILDELRAIAPVLAIGDQTTSSWQDDLRLVAEATGTQTRAAELIAQYDARVAEVSEAYADVLASQTFAPINVTSDGSDVRPNRLLSTVLQDLGAAPSAAFAEAIQSGEGIEYSPEQLVSKWSDATAVVALVNDAASWNELQTDSLWTQLPAVAGGHVVRSDKQTHEGAALTALHSIDVIESLLATF
ncbi:MULTISPECIES: ABC transporter substrate-binding protein [Microbacterium]|uniref:ABC transporter substrate-binding protein n=1 Tax=Microbacterium TaxID=33882 RepID=UPI002784386B|nr:MULTISPECIES: ABC transporter substrate-binding protein [Microbacterium]MDQ1085445.1 iron complex transport system substrate-binding protein [Microbacterium sp. SORGH_AS_0344]MDQ1169249.1 iron complex transport system substrate-binding protein [Microbacterium proteolyticum]